MHANLVVFGAELTKIAVARFSQKIVNIIKREIVAQLDKIISSSKCIIQN